MQQSVSEPRASAWRTRAPLTACGVTPALAFSREGTFSFMSQSNAERVALVALLLHMVLPSPHVASMLPEEWERGDEEGCRAFSSSWLVLDTAARSHAGGIGQTWPVAPQVTAGMLGNLVVLCAQYHQNWIREGIS